MTKITSFIPSGTLAAEDLAVQLDTMRKAERFTPFAPELLNFAGDFSQRLLGDKEARAWPESQALGFWLRPAALAEMKKNFAVPPHAIAVPQGIVFHIPPANADVMFAYSLFMALLCGNANIVRLPSRRGPVTEILIRLIGEALQGKPGMRRQILLLGYDHDIAITGLLGKAADLRVIWGGDRTVEAIRGIALAPWGRELVFPDRFSWAAVDRESFRALDARARAELARKFFNDLFWFDQAGCSSPRILLWRGKRDEKLFAEFYQAVAKATQAKNWRLDAGGSVMKQTRQYGAMADVAIKAKLDFGPLTVFELEDLSGLKALRDNPCFGGTLFEYCVSDLVDVAAHIERRDQTLTHSGFKRTELEEFAAKLGGRGFDRIVPVGQALAFDTIWDGQDLPHAFTRLVKVEG